MAVGNSLTAKKQNSDRVEFEVAGEKITLTPQIVRDYLVSGDKERVSMQEVVMFINLCKYAGLNPWLKEAYCIKYGSEPATMVVGKEAFMKRAENSYRVEVSFDEYAARKKDGSLNSQWSKKPATMIRKVALVQALREAFPENFSGLYSEEETGTEETSFLTPPDMPVTDQGPAAIPEQEQPTTPPVQPMTENAQMDMAAAFFNK